MTPNTSLSQVVDEFLVTWGSEFPFIYFTID